MAESFPRQNTYQKTMSSSEIYHALKEDILKLKLRPGQMISENEIAAFYCVSRTPVKIAFVRLESEGFIEVIPQKGSYITLIDAKHIRDIIYMRYVLEMDMCKVAQNSPDFAHLLDALEKNLEEQKKIIQDPSLSPYTFYEVDSRFHHLLFAHSGHEQIWSVIQANQVFYTRFRLLDTTVTSRYGQLVGEHEAILAALKNQDIDALDQGVHQHLHKNLSLLEKTAGRHRDYFVKYE